MVPPGPGAGGRCFSRSGRWSVKGEGGSGEGRDSEEEGAPRGRWKLRRAGKRMLRKGRGLARGGELAQGRKRRGLGGGDRPAAWHRPTPGSPPPHTPPPSSAGSWRSASERALSATRRRCARCCRCASAAARAPRPRPRPPRRTRRPPREPCSAWCRGRPGRPTGRCPCWRASSRLSLASRGVCPAKAASEDPGPPWRPSSFRPEPLGAVWAPHGLQDGPRAGGSPAAA